MAQQNRIPEFATKSFDGMLLWFSQMSVRGLLFHPDDDPSDVFSIASGKRTFHDDEVIQVRETLTEMFERHGDAVYEAAYPIFMRAVGIQLDS